MQKIRVVLWGDDDKVLNIKDVQVTKGSKGQFVGEIRKQLLSMIDSMCDENEAHITMHKM